MPKQEILAKLEELRLLDHADDARKRKRIHVPFTYVYRDRRDRERLEAELLAFGFQRGLLSWEIEYD